MLIGPVFFPYKASFPRKRESSLELGLLYYPFNAPDDNMCVETDHRLSTFRTSLIDKVNDVSIFPLIPY